MSKTITKQELYQQWNNYTYDQADKGLMHMSYNQWLKHYVYNNQ